MKTKHVAKLFANDISKHILIENIWFDYNFIKVIHTGVSDYESVFILCCPLTIPMMTPFIDAYMRHKASLI